MQARKSGEFQAAGSTVTSPLARPPRMIESKREMPRNLQNAGPIVTCDQSQLRGVSIVTTCGVTTIGDTRIFRRIDLARAEP